MAGFERRVSASGAFGMGERFTGHVLVLVALASRQHRSVMITIGRDGKESNQGHIIGIVWICNTNNIFEVNADICD